MLFIRDYEAASSEQTQQFAALILLFILILLVGLFSFVYMFLREKKFRQVISHERDRVQLKEEQYRAAVMAADIHVGRYDLRTGICYNDSNMMAELGFGAVIENVPQTFVDAGVVAAGSVADLLEFYQKVRQGEETCTAAVSLQVPDGSFRWFRLEKLSSGSQEIHYDQVILTCCDVTEERDREAAYARWQQSIKQRDPETYTLFFCNLTKGTSFDQKEGSLLKINFSPEVTTFNDRTLEYAAQYVYEVDYDSYVALLNVDFLLAAYYRGEQKHTLEYRMRSAENTLHWLRLTVETIQYPKTKDIQAFLLYENIDDAKTFELQTREKAELDPLTGLLNREAFRTKFEQLLHNSDAASGHTFMLLDIDDFKVVNDSFGHAAGDQVLIDVANVR